jgi:hypothetical protein
MIEKIANIIIAPSAFTYAIISLMIYGSGPSKSEMLECKTRLKELVDSGEFEKTYLSGNPQISFFKDKI